MDRSKDSPPILTMSCLPPMQDNPISFMACFDIGMYSAKRIDLHDSVTEKTEEDPYWAKAGILQVESDATKKHNCLPYGKAK